MPTIIPFNAFDSYTPFGVINQGISLSNTVKQCIKDNEVIMKPQGMKNVYIDETEQFPSVIIVWKSDYQMNYEFWRDIRERIRQSGAEYVSNIYENDKSLRIEGMASFI